MPVGVRTNSGSPSCSRGLPSHRLMVGWLCPSCLAVRVTLRVSYSTSNKRGAAWARARSLLGYSELIFRAASAADAVRGADIVTTVTADKVSATIITPDRLEPGMQLNAMGSVQAKQNCMPMPAGPRRTGRCPAATPGSLAAGWGVNAELACTARCAP